MEFAPLVVASALVWKLVTFLKALTAKDYRTALTLAIVWVAGVAVAFLLGASDFADTIKVGGQVLGDFNGASLVLFGTALGSTAAVGYDVKGAIDSSDSAVEPKLGGGE